MPNTENQTAISLDQLARFCRTAGRKCFANFSPEGLADYLAFHGQHRSLRWTRNAHGEIAALAIAWRMAGAEICRRHALGQLVFDWQPDDPQGDALFIGAGVATDRLSLASVISALITRYPGCGRLSWWTIRRGQLHRMNPHIAVVLLRQATHHQLH